MNATNQYCLRRALRCAIVALSAICGVYGQTQINLGTQGRNVDFSNAPSTRPVKTGTALPATCSVGDLFFQSSAPQGQNLYGCSAVNTWALLGGGASVLFYQTFESKGAALAEQPALNFSSAFSATDDSASSRTDVDLATVNSNVGTFGGSSQVPIITVNGQGLITGVSSAPISGGGVSAWGSITGLLSSQTDLQAALAAKQATGTYVTTLTGDITASGPGSAPATLANVNSGAGQCGDATHICQVTTNAKGLVTSQSAVGIAGGSGNATSFQGIAISSSAPANLQVLQFQSGSNSYVPANISGLASNWTAGAFASIPAACTPGSGAYVYFATDQPPGQQEYQCSAANTWTQALNIGSSGALAMVDGSLDIVTSVIPRLPNTNTFTGSNSFTGPIFQIGGTSSDPGCTQTSDIGKLWINTTSAANTLYEVCLSVSSALQWVVK